MTFFQCQNIYFTMQSTKLYNFCKKNHPKAAPLTLAIIFTLQSFASKIPYVIVWKFLFYLEEFSLEEIAEITGMQANTAKVRIHRARQRLADELKNLLNHEALTL